MANFGVSFLPHAGGPAGATGQPGGPRGPQLQEAIKILSLRLPRVVGGATAAPSALLTGAGSQGNPLINSAVGQTQKTILPPSLAAPQAPIGMGPGITGAPSPHAQAQAPALGAMPPLPGPGAPSGPALSFGEGAGSTSQIADVLRRLSERQPSAAAAPPPPPPPWATTQAPPPPPSLTETPHVGVQPPTAPPVPSIPAEDPNDRPPAGGPYPINSGGPNSYYDQFMPPAATVPTIPTESPNDRPGAPTGMSGPFPITSGGPNSYYDNSPSMSGPYERTSGGPNSYYDNPPPAATGGTIYPPGGYQFGGGPVTPRPLLPPGPDVEALLRAVQGRAAYTRANLFNGAP